MYDVKCLELARAFLEDEPEERRTPEHETDLAQAIQDAIEAYLEALREGDDEL
jgi:hypothetical protein